MCSTTPWTTTVKAESWISPEKSTRATVVGLWGRSTRVPWIMDAKLFCSTLQVMINDGWDSMERRRLCISRFPPLRRHRHEINIPIIYFHAIELSRFITWIRWSFAHITPIKHQFQLFWFHIDVSLASYGFDQAHSIIQREEIRNITSNITFNWAFIGAFKL